MKKKFLSGKQKFKIILETFEKNNVAEIAKKINYYNNKRIHNSIKMNPKIFTKSFF